MSQKEKCPVCDVSVVLDSYANKLWYPIHWNPQETREKGKPVTCKKSGKVAYK